MFKNIVFKPPVNVSPRTKIRAIREIRVHIKNRVKSVCKIIRSIRLIRVQKILVFKPPVSALAANKIRAIRAIRVRIKYRDKSV